MELSQEYILHAISYRIHFSEEVFFLFAQEAKWNEKDHEKGEMRENKYLYSAVDGILCTLCFALIFWNAVYDCSSYCKEGFEIRIYIERIVSWKNPCCL